MLVSGNDAKILSNYYSLKENCILVYSAEDVLDNSVSAIKRKVKSLEKNRFAMKLFNFIDYAYAL